MEKLSRAQTQPIEENGGEAKAPRRLHKKLRKNDWELLTMVWLGVLFVAVFCYAPLFGIVLAFKDGNNVLNIMNAILYGDWVGWDNFRSFLADGEFIDVMLNTLGLNSLMMLINFPAPVLFALLLNEIRPVRFKRTAQTISYLPHFLSWVVFGGIISALVNTDTGVLNALLVRSGLSSAPVDIIGDPKYFWGLIIVTSLIKGIGWGSIIYLAAISGVSKDLYEAAEIDGASRVGRILHVTLPGIAPSVVTFFLLSVSGILNSTVEHILVFQTQTNLSRSQVIDTMVLQYGLNHGMYSYATAIGLFKSVIACGLLVASNFLCKKLTGKGVY